MSRPGDGAAWGMAPSSAPRRNTALQCLWARRGISPAVTRSRDTGMAPTSYWESTREKSRANSSASMGVSPTIWAHCSRALHRMSHSWLYSWARAGSPRSWRAAVRSSSRSGRPMRSRKAYRALVWPRPVWSGFFRSSSRGAMTCRRTALSRASRASSSGLRGRPYPLGCMVQSPFWVQRLPRRSHLRA